LKQNSHVSVFDRVALVRNTYSTRRSGDTCSFYESKVCKQYQNKSTINEPQC